MQPSKFWHACCPLRHCIPLFAVITMIRCWSPVPSPVPTALALHHGMMYQACIPMPQCTSHLVPSVYTTSVLQVALMTADEKCALQSAAQAGKLKDGAAARRSTSLGWITWLPLRAASYCVNVNSSLLAAPLLAIPVVGWAAYLIINGNASGGRSRIWCSWGDCVAGSPYILTRMYISL